MLVLATPVIDSLVADKTEQAEALLRRSPRTAVLAERMACILKDLKEQEGAPFTRIDVDATRDLEIPSWIKLVFTVKVAGDREEQDRWDLRLGEREFELQQQLSRRDCILWCDRIWVRFRREPKPVPT